MEASVANSSAATVREFVARVDAHDPRGIVELCTPDHVFIDSLGTRLSGLTHIERAWTGYFSLFPDYFVEIEELVSHDALVLLSGWASALGALI